jgi:hypothetical protein
MAPPTVYNMTVDPIRRWRPLISIFCTVRFKQSHFLCQTPQRTGEIYDNEITSLIDIYFLRISFIPSDPFRYFIYVTYSTDK